MVSPEAYVPMGLFLACLEIGGVNQLAPPFLDAVNRETSNSRHQTMVVLAGSPHIHMGLHV